MCVPKDVWWLVFGWTVVEKPCKTKTHQFWMESSTFIEKSLKYTFNSDKKRLKNLSKRKLTRNNSKRSKRPLMRAVNDCRFCINCLRTGLNYCITTTNRDWFKFFIHTKMFRPPLDLNLRPHERWASTIPPHT